MNKSDVMAKAIIVLLVANAGTVAEASQQSQTVACERFVLTKTGRDLASLAATFSTTLAGLRKLNPALLEQQAGPPEPGVATPVCVVGTVLPTTTAAASAASVRVEDGSAQQQTGGKRIGKRPTSTVAFVTTPGVHTCYDIIMKAQPPLDITTFVEMNPTLDCSTLPGLAATVYLPKGTKIGKKETPRIAASGDRDCLFGAWGDWTECNDHTVNQTRFRTIYREASGSGTACPPASETRPCNTTADHGPSRRMMLPANQCPAGYDGCSVPSGLPYYHLFVPACNLHDICYSCNRHKGWEFATQSYCDSTVFYSKMTSQCSSYWTKWWQSFDKSYCNTMAAAYWVAVRIAGNPDRYENKNPNLLADGCYYKPGDPQINNVKGGGFLPSAAGCPCPGTSCQYW